MRSLPLSLAALSLVVLLTNCASVRAQSADTAARLVAIKAGVASTERVIADLKVEFAKLKAEEAKLKESLQGLQREELELNKRSAQVNQDRARIVAEVEVAEKNVAKHQGVIRERLRGLYMNSASSSGGLVLGAAKSADLERVAVYARSVRSFDRARFIAIAKAVEELIARRGALDRSLEESARLQDKLKVKRGELERQQVRLADVMRQIDDKQQAAKRSLNTLMEEATKLEELLRSITSGDQVAEPERIDVPEQTPAVARDEDRVIKRSMQDVMHPGGLFAQSARVVYPVRGEILQRFGKTKVTNFADMIFSKGFEFKTNEGSDVKAVLGGKVAFAGSMPGYDMVVIIDHGARSYSLYGRLGKAVVAKGDVVAQRDVIGVTSAPDNKGRNFYFETRKNGAPVDPSSVLTRVSN